MDENTETQNNPQADADSSGTSGSLTPNVKSDSSGNPIVSEIADADGKIYDIAAKRFANNVTVQLTGAVEGKVERWNGKDPLTIANEIPDGSLTTAKLGNGAVTTGKIADGAVTLDKINDDAKGTSIATGDADKLATVSAVKTYVDDQVSGKGSYLGKKSVAEINALLASGLHNGDRVMVTDSGSIVHGEGGQAMTVRQGEDLILYKVNDGEYQWQSIDGNFKIKGATLEKTMGGTEIITSLKQDANGDLTVATSKISSATSESEGIAKLYGSTGSATDGAMTQKAVSDELAKMQQELAFDGAYDKDTNKAATVSSVTSRINALDAEVTSTDGKNVQVKVTEVDGKITAVNVSDSSANAQDLADEITARTNADTALDNRVKALEGTSHTHSDTEKAALTSGITSGKVESYDNHLADTTVHITAEERTAWTAKQDAIADLATIRAGAAKGATAVQPGDKLSTLTDDITVDTYTSDSEAPISGKGVKAALDTLDATATSTDGTNVQVKVTQTDGKVTEVSITADNTASSDALATETSERKAADKTLQDNIDKKQDILDVEYDPDNQRITFKNVTFNIAK